jgi:hypothetical protein
MAIVSLEVKWTAADNILCWRVSPMRFVKPLPWGRESFTLSVLQIKPCAARHDLAPAPGIVAGFMSSRGVAT